MQIRPTLTALLLILLATHLHAQPTLTKAVHEPQIGDQVVYTQWDTTGIRPGSAGANQAWSFTLQTTQIPIMDTLRYTAPSGPADTLYANADIMAWHTVWFGPNDTEVREFLVREASTLRYEGYHMSLIVDGGQAVFSQTAPTLAYPMSYGDILADSAKGAYLGLWYQPFSGLSYLEADAHGSLTVNGQSYTNVLRVHEWDSIPVPGIKYQTETWRYYLPGQRYPVFTISYDGFRYTPYTSSALSTDRAEPKPELGIKVYPQPARERLFIETTADFVAERITVFDVRGKLMVETSEVGSGKRVEMDTEKWPLGWYVLRLEGKGGRQMNAKVWVAE